MVNKSSSNLTLSRTLRSFLVVTGFIALLLGIIGVVLPIIPTTPFVLLAAACFAKSSNRFHSMFLNNRFFGFIIKNWQAKRCICRPVRYMALGSMVFTFSLSIGFVVNEFYIRLLLVTVAAILVMFLWRVALCENIEDVSFMVFWQKY